MKNEKILTAIGKIGDDLIADAEICPKAKSRTPQWVKWVAMAACLCLLITGGSVIGNMFGEKENINLNPLVITVYAQSEDGTIVPTALKVGEKVKMYPATSPHTENFDGYAFDLTLLDAKYISPSVVTEDWEPKLYTGDYQYTDDDFHWALTAGDDIYVVHRWPDGSAVRPGEHENGDPAPHGSAIIWRPNDDGLNRNIISVYSEDFELIAKYYLEITEENGDYYAEIVKVDN